VVRVDAVSAVVESPPPMKSGAFTDAAWSAVAAVEDVLLSGFEAVPTCASVTSPFVFDEVPSAR
jgi:hypothetical protein